MEREYDTTQQAALVTLAWLAVPTSNTDLRGTHKVNLGPRQRDRLNSDGLITSVKIGRCLRHTITEAGLAWAEQALPTVPVPTGTPPLARVLVEMTRQRLAAHLPDTAPASPGQQAPLPAQEGGEWRDTDLEEKIRAAYGELAQAPGAPVRLAALRRRLPGHEHRGVSHAMVALHRRGEFHLLAHRDWSAADEDDHGAAIRLSGLPKHFLASGPDLELTAGTAELDQAAFAAAVADWLRTAQPSRFDSGWYPILPLRAHLDALGLGRAHQDRRLKDLMLKCEIHAVHEPRTWALEQRDFEAALHCGGDRLDLIRVHEDAQHPALRALL